MDVGFGPCFRYCTPEITSVGFVSKLWFNQKARRRSWIPKDRVVDGVGLGGFEAGRDALLSEKAGLRGSVPV